MSNFMSIGYYLLYDLSLFMSRTRSVLDPTQTRPVGVGWRNSKSTARINQSSWFWVRVSIGQFDRLSEAKKSHRNLQKSCWNLEKVVGICIFFAKNCRNLARFGYIPPDLVEISSDLVEISLDLVEISLDLACFCRFGWIFNMALVVFKLLGFWRSKSITRLVGVSSWKRKLLVDWLDLRFGSESGQCWAVWPGCRVSVGSRQP